MIKKLTFILLAAGCTQIMYAQSTEKNEKFLENKTLFEELTNVKKKQDTPFESTSAYIVSAVAFRYDELATIRTDTDTYTQVF